MRIDQQKNLDEAVVEIQNDYVCSIVYSVGSVRRELPVGAKMKVKVKELYELVNTVGGRKVLEKGKILLKESEVRDYLGLPELDKYNPSLEEIKELIKNPDIDRLEELLMYCSSTTLEKIVNSAIEAPISNMQAARLIHQYSGKDVISIIQEREQDGDSQEETVRKPTKEGETPRRRKKIVE